MNKNMNIAKMESLIKTLIPFDKLVINSGIYVFHNVEIICAGVSYEEYEGNEVYIFNLFYNNEYINISNIGVCRETINEMVETWNRLEKRSYINA